jgi:DNA repair protein RadD
MISIETLTENIPDGTKRELLGVQFIDGLLNYSKENAAEVNLNELLVLEFDNLVSQKVFLNLLKLWCAENLSIVCGVPDINTMKIKDIKDAILYYYKIDIVQEENKANIVSYKTSTKIKLHDFQERIRRKVINLMFKQKKRFIIHMPTGSGKTRTAAEIILDFVRFSPSKALLDNKIKILWLAQSEELCFQAYETIKDILNQKGTTDIGVGHFYGKNEIDDTILDKPAIIFCGIQKLLLNYNKPIWANIKNNTYLVVVDEAHRSVAEKWINAINYFVADKSVYLIGLTATPGIGKINSDTTPKLSTFYQGEKIKLLDEHYNDIPNPIQWLIEQEFLAKINRIQIESNYSINGIVNNSEIKGNFDFSDQTLKELSIIASRNSIIINILVDEYKKGKKILVFSCGIQHSKTLKAILAQKSIKSETIDANTPNRNSIIERFKKGDLNILINYGVLTTGFDAPNTDVCVIARPIESIVMYSQMVGRILRGPNNTGNKENTLYTIKDNINLHGDYDEMYASFDEFYK